MHPVLLGEHRLQLLLGGDALGGEPVGAPLIVTVGCANGFVELSDGLSCGCPAGSYFDDTACSLCAAGTHAASTGAYLCDACAPGTFAADSGSVECLPCRPGTFSGEEEAAFCLPCTQGTFSGSGAVACEPCGVYDLAARTAETNRDESPFGINCSGQVLHGALQGYWAERILQVGNANASRAWACELPQANPDSCLGGAASACLQGHDDSWALCARCVDGYFLDAQRLCLKLPEGDDTSSFLGAQYGVLGLVLVTLGAMALTLVCFCLTVTPPPRELAVPWVDAVATEADPNMDNKLTIWMQRDKDGLGQRLQKWFRQLNLVCACR